MRLVATDLKVFGSEVVDRLHLPEDLQLGERSDLPLELGNRSRVRHNALDMEESYI